MKNKEKKIEEPSVEEMSKFFTTMQAKQELESFVKEKGLNFQFGTYGEDADEPPYCNIEGKIEIGDNTRWVAFGMNALPVVAGCFMHQLTCMKMIVERISKDIPLYDHCRDIYFDARSSSLTMSYRQSETSDCIRLKIDFIVDDYGCSMLLSAYKMWFNRNGVGDDIPLALCSHNNNKGRVTLMERVFIHGFEAIEGSYMFWHERHKRPIPNSKDIENSYRNEPGKPKLDPKVRAIFRHDDTRNDFQPQHAPDFLIRMCKLITLSSGINTDFAVTAALVEVLGVEGVKILDAYTFPSLNACCYAWSNPSPFTGLIDDIVTPIVVAVSFSVNGRKFVYHRNINFGEFCIDEIGTGNKLVIRESFNNTDVGKIRSTICRFLGVQL